MNRDTAKAIAAALNRPGREPLRLEWHAGVYHLQHRRTQRHLQNPAAGQRYSRQAPWVDIPDTPPFHTLADVAAHLGITGDAA